MMLVLRVRPARLLLLHARVRTSSGDDRVPSEFVRV
jgi:hypothetical protein